ncbi:MAG: hypothetical protein OEQ90_09535 [Gammaproteobacteria bacterium]|nr:hypothetical protein [Gammaproteobacteria bacterium]
MIRLIGILTGSAIAVAFLIVALGMPEFAVPEPAVVALTEARPEERPEPVETVTEPLALVPEPLAPIPGPQTPGARPSAEVADQVTPVTGPVEPDPEPEVTTEEIAEPLEQHWYAFWSPFRSKIAADGFVSQLQRTTGLDYRVVKLKPGVYEVAFAYSDDSDIEHKLTQISSATGLDLSGG